MRAIRDAGATIVLVEHNFGLVLDLADQIYVLVNGQLLTSGSPDEIAAHPAVLEQYLGVKRSAPEAGARGQPDGRTR